MLAFFVLYIKLTRSINRLLTSYLQVQYRKRLFKPKVKLLSEAEYLDQSRVETARALQNLRDYCQSPKCNAWRTVSSLTSPSRFAEFIEGNPSDGDQNAFAMMNVMMANGNLLGCNDSEKKYFDCDPTS